MKKLILGWGKSGKAAAKLLQKNVLVFDQNPNLEIKDFESVFCLDEKLLGKIDQIIVSPGFDPHHIFLQKARQRKVEIIGEIELAFRHLKNRCIGITGTNGKTTTTLLCCHFLQMNGFKAKALGNIGEPLSSYALNADTKEILVIELSSFQLETLSSKCLDIALILNISPNHLDRHTNFEEYARAKMHIRSCLKPGGRFFVSQNVRDLFFEKENIETFEEPVFFKNLGNIHSQNVMAAKKITKMLGAKNFSLKGFKTSPHRLQFVREKEGVLFYNDSKATNVEAVISAVQTLKGPILLICGGVDKRSSYFPWKKAFKGRVKHVFTIGNSAKKIRKELESEFQVRMEKSLYDAVISAFGYAEKNDNILLSPGCSSFDQFENFEKRGEEFMRIVESM